MRKIIYLPLFVIVLLTLAGNVRAQTSAVDSLLKSDKKASFKFGINYLNNIVFMGRADTISTPAIVPELKYSFKNGVFVSASADYIPDRVKNKLDGGSLTLGYDYDITDDLSGSVSFTKMFFSVNSTQIGSAITSTFNANMDYDIAGIITPSVSIDYNLVNQGVGNDVFVNVGLSHDFAKEGIFGERDLFIISPTVEVNTGTQNFYDAYFIRKYKLKAAKANAQKKLAALSKYTLLDYEFSAPVEYKIGILILSFTPTYTYAANKLPPRITAGMVKPGIFYFETGAAVKF